MCPVAGVGSRRMRMELAVSSLAEAGYEERNSCIWRVYQALLPRCPRAECEGKGGLCQLCIHALSLPQPGYCVSSHGRVHGGRTK